MKYDFQMIIKAINYATEKHDGQKRLDGRPYITHPLAVAGMLDNPKAQIIAVLHDILEDTNVTVDELIEEFGDEIGLSVLALSRIEAMSYEDYILGIKVLKLPLCREVKIADLRNNLSTIENIPDLEKRKRLKDRYIKALKVLEG